jgi:hypothetical protein
MYTDSVTGWPPNFASLAGPPDWAARARRPGRASPGVHCKFKLPMAAGPQPDLSHLSEILAHIQPCSDELQACRRIGAPRRLGFLLRKVQVHPLVSVITPVNLQNHASSNRVWYRRLVFGQGHRRDRVDLQSELIPGNLDFLAFQFNRWCLNPISRLGSLLKSRPAFKHFLPIWGLPLIFVCNWESSNKIPYNCNSSGTRRR